MSSLLSVGLDVGTTTTQFIVSRLRVENKASSFSVPEMEISNREILYRSPIHFTPLLGQDLVDGEAIRNLVTAQYEKANIKKEQVDTGAVIITGETSRKENAKAVLHALSDFAGDFVVATAGPALESILAAKGAGAAELSAKESLPVLHMDIGGGTSNLALLKEGKVVATGCLNVGGRLIKTDPQGKITYLSPVLTGLTDLQIGDYPAAGQLLGIAKILATALEMAAGLRPATELLEKLTTKELNTPWTPPEETCILSFSGGVADCIESALRPGIYGDMGVELGQAIRESLLCKDRYVLGKHTIGATVIGAGCHSTQLSGSTVFYRNTHLPQKNIPAVIFTEEEQFSPDLPALIEKRILDTDRKTAVLCFPGHTLTYESMSVLAHRITKAMQGRPIFVSLQADFAKALGQKLSLLLPTDAPCLCIDRCILTEESYLDIGNPIGPALPVVVKTLVLQ